MSDGLAAYLAECDEPAGYLDFARIGPPLRCVRRAAAAALDSATGVDGDPMVPLGAAHRRALDAAADVVGVPGAEVVLMPSTTAALFAVAFGLPGGGTVLVPDGEFPANVVPWLRAAERGGPAVRRVARDGDRISLARLADALDPQVRAVTVSAVDYAAGALAPLAQIRDVIGPDRLLVVDAIQGLGACELDLAVADVVVGGGQKWLRAGWGAAVLALAPRAMDQVGSGLGGWPGLADPLAGGEDLATTVAGPTRFPMTNGDPVAIAALGAALHAVSAAGVPAVARRLREVTDAVRDVLRRAGAEVARADDADVARSGIVAFSLPGEPATATVERLARHGLTTAVRGPRVRVSPHASTSADTLARLAEALPRP